MFGQGIERICCFLPDFSSKSVSIERKNKQKMRGEMYIQEDATQGSE